MQSDAKTPDQYIAELPEDRAKVIAKLRKIAVENLPSGFKEMMNYGMMVDEVRVGEGNLNVLKASAEFLISSGSSISFFCRDIFFLFT